MKIKFIPVFFILLMPFLLLFSCKNTDLVKPKLVGFEPLGRSVITTTSRFGYGYKINSTNITLPTVVLTGNYVALRIGTTFRDSIFANKTGTLIENVPQNLLQIICLNNKKHTEIVSSATGVMGWKIEKVHFIAANGSTTPISDLLDSTTAKALSYTICFFSDGVYKIFNHVNQDLNQTGVFQPIIEKNLMIGIIYKPQYLGISNIAFENHPSFSVNAFGYGIWGVTESNFHPIYSIDKKSDAILTMSKISL